MSETSRREVRAGLEPSLARLWRYALVLARARDVADDLVQATCLRAVERANQFVPGTRVDRWLFAILRSIWLNEIRSQGIREGGHLRRS
jgi:RNA polymerase sigma-70 factor, ECF subfamily